MRPRHVDAVATITANIYTSGMSRRWLAALVLVASIGVVVPAAADTTKTMSDRYRGWDVTYGTPADTPPAKPVGQESFSPTPPPDYHPAQTVWTSVDVTVVDDHFPDVAAHYELWQEDCTTSQVVCFNVMEDEGEFCGSTSIPVPPADWYVNHGVPSGYEKSSLNIDILGPLDTAAICGTPVTDLAQGTTGTITAVWHAD